MAAAVSKSAVQPCGPSAASPDGSEKAADHLDENLR
eukprot:CAMPEP_0119503486 /NCGR_PEP_ID=MMETSP1344-20130328/24641_1 /TAXON_ID=236787 /ORGANISM="Florenciella parvula, Strain CCMP2471" /LENGTH=35 /DNA_ID= /DNA_START= /DNA_END= /DNA_ORIENTATION=